MIRKPLIEKIVKEEEVKIKIQLPESKYKELLNYTKYLGGQEQDVEEVIVKMIDYVLEKENKTRQYKEFKKNLEKNDNSNPVV